MRLFVIRQHENSLTHKIALNRLKSNISSDNIVQYTNKKLSPFAKDLCSALIAADIPFYKLENKEFRNFLEKYTNKKIPNESTLRKNYLQPCYNDVINATRKEMGNCAIWVSIDETIDVTKRPIGNVVIGTLENDKSGKKFLLHCEQLTEVNNMTIAQLFTTSLQLLWPEGVQYEKVLLFVTDGAAYMLKAAKNLITMYPNMIHVTCVIHGLHRVAEEIRAYYPDIDNLISSVKKVFLKAPSRIELFKKIAPNLALPPQPVITRWGTWLKAAKYYADNYATIKLIIETLPVDAASIKTAKECFENNLEENLHTIKNNFTCLISAIKQLEKSNISLYDSLNILSEVRKNIEQPHIPDKIRNKMAIILRKNNGLQILINISENKQPLPLNSEQLKLLKYAPIVSSEVECTFSRYKAVLTDRRQNFKFNNLSQYFVTHCYKSNK